MNTYILVHMYMYVHVCDLALETRVGLLTVYPSVCIVIYTCVFSIAGVLNCLHSQVREFGRSTKSSLGELAKCTAGAKVKTG